MAWPGVEQEHPRDNDQSGANPSERHEAFGKGLVWNPGNRETLVPDVPEAYATVLGCRSEEDACNRPAGVDGGEGGEHEHEGTIGAAEVSFHLPIICLTTSIDFRLLTAELCILLHQVCALPSTCDSLFFLARATCAVKTSRAR